MKKIVASAKNTLKGLVCISATMLSNVDYSPKSASSIDPGRGRAVSAETELSQFVNDGRVVSPKMFGAIGDGISDDTRAFQQAFDSGQDVLIEEGKYRINSTLHINKGDAIITGQNDNVTIFSNTIKRLVTVTDVSNLTIRNISFQVLTNDTVEAANEWCVGWFFDPKTTLSSSPIARQNKIIRCRFSSPNSCVNGVKLIAHRSGIGGRIDDFLIDSCQFTKIGRMGIEVLGEKDGNWYSNVRVMNCKFDDLGRHSKYGMAVSLSGDGSHNMIENLNIEAAKDIALENSGAQYTTFQSVVYKNLKSKCIPYTVSGYDGYTPRHGNKVSRNIVIGPVEASPQFINQIDLCSKNNKVSSDSPFILANVHFSRFIEDRMNSSESPVVLLRQGSSNNRFFDCYIGNKNAKKSFVAIVVEASGKYNYFVRTRYTRSKVGGKFFTRPVEPDSTIITKKLSISP